MESYERLEHEWSVFNGLDPAGMVACASGTAALHLAFQAMRDERDGYVVMPDYTMVACARAATMAELTPVFVDCLPFELTTDPSLVADALTSACGGGYQVYALAVHTYGRRCSLDWTMDPETRRSVKIVEDLAEAHGIEVHPSTDAACWSFYINKIVAGEEGGAVWFRNPDHATRARSLRSLGFTPAHDYTHIPFGHNYRMSNVHADLILKSVKSYTCNLADRWDRWHSYTSAIPPHLYGPKPDAPWVFDLQVGGLDRIRQTELVRGLQALRLTARFGFVPMTAQPEYAGVPEANPVSFRAWTEVVYLPLDPTLYLPVPLLALVRYLILKYDVG